MAIYQWQNIETGEVVETNSYDKPPEAEGKWKRIYSFGLGPVAGAGESPVRSYYTRS